MSRSPVAQAPHSCGEGLFLDSGLILGPNGQGMGGGAGRKWMCPEVLVLTKDTLILQLKADQLDSSKPTAKVQQQQQQQGRVPHAQPQGATTAGETSALAAAQDAACLHSDQNQPQLLLIHD